MRILILVLAFLLFGCGKQERGWIPLLSSQKWYQDISNKEKRLTGRIYDKGKTRWIVKGHVKAEKGVIPEREFEYKKGEEYNRFLFETGVAIYDIYLGDFWLEERMEEIVGIDKETKALSSKKFEIIGKERVFFVEEGGKKIKKREFIPGMIRQK
ncbi:MAG: hypothetical protein AB1630_01830 [bacterium]